MSQPDAQAQVELLARAQEEIKQLKGEVNQLKDELNQVSGIYDDEWNDVRASQNSVILLNLLNGELEVDEERLMEVMKTTDKEGQAFMAYKYTEMLPGESLQEHVTRQAASPACPGPHQAEAMIYMSQRYMNAAQFPNFEMAKKYLAGWWLGSSWKFWREGSGPEKEEFKHAHLHQSQEWNSQLKNVMSGNYLPYGILCMHPGRPGKIETQAVYMINYPIIITNDGGKRKFWGQMREAILCKKVDYHDSFLRYVQYLKNTPVCITVVNSETGNVVKQNLTSMAMFGNHGVHDRIKLNSDAEQRRAASFTLSSGHPSSDSSSEDGLSFLELLFFDQSEELVKLRSSNVAGLLYSTRIEIKSQRLKTWMQLGPDEVAYHDLHAVIIKDPITYEPVYILTHVDVTATVLAQKAVLKANEDLAAEKIRMDALLKRQYELIEVLQAMPKGGLNNEVADKIAFLHEQLKEAGAVSPAEADDIKLLSILGRGQFGTVFLGEWRGATVAVKRIVLPAVMSNSERAQKMAVMEIAISSSMNHPNLVQTYTYSIKQVKDETDGIKMTGAAHLHAHEMRLVLEFCDRGSLQAYVRHYKGVRDESGTLMYANLVETAADIARGMLHLHKNHICHNDLKTANILMKNEGNDGRGVRAKVMDFGLSIKLDTSATHLSNAFQGTLSHMAPEVLSEGKQSRAADVYSFGVTLWEMCTGQAPYRGLNHVALSQLVVCKHKRPTLPKDIPADLQILIERCWQPAPSGRPSFEVILDELQKLKAIMGEVKPWPIAVPGDLSSEKLHVAESGGNQQQPSELTEALFVSQISFVSLEGWTPVIMGPSDEEEAKASRDGTSLETSGSLTRKRSSVRDKAVAHPPKLSLEDLLGASKTSSEALEKVPNPSISVLPPPQTPPSFSDMIQIGVPPVTTSADAPASRFATTSHGASVDRGSSVSLDLAVPVANPDSPRLTDFSSPQPDPKSGTPGMTPGAEDKEIKQAKSSTLTGSIKRSMKRLFSFKKA